MKRSAPYRFAPWRSSVDFMKVGPWALCMQGVALSRRPGKRFARPGCFLLSSGLAFGLGGAGLALRRSFALWRGRRLGGFRRAAGGFGLGRLGGGLASLFGDQLKGLAERDLIGRGRF